MLPSCYETLHINWLGTWGRILSWTIQTILHTSYSAFQIKILQGTIFTKQSFSIVKKQVITFYKVQNMDHFILTLQMDGNVSAVFLLCREPSPLPPDSQELQALVARDACLWKSIAVSKSADTFWYSLYSFHGFSFQFHISGMSYILWTHPQGTMVFAQTKHIQWINTCEWLLPKILPYFQKRY